jgi:hypothetical protein
VPPRWRRMAPSTIPTVSRATCGCASSAFPRTRPETWKRTRERTKAFPHDGTAQQLYGDREFEAYRRLREIAAQMALEPPHHDKPARPLPQVLAQVQLLPRPTFRLDRAACERRAPDK